MSQPPYPQPQYPQPPHSGPAVPPVPPAPSPFGGPYPTSPQGEYQPGAYPQVPYDDGPRKSFLATWLLSLLLGTFGADRFYLGKTGSAVAKLLTAGGLGIWAIVDLVMTLTGNTRDIHGGPLEGYPENKKKAWIITAVVWLVGAVTGAVLAIASIAVVSAAVEGFNVPAQAPLPASQAAQAPSPGTSTEANSSVVTMSEGNTVRVGVLDSIYTAEIPGMSYLEPKNGGFLAVQVSWETVSGTSFATPSNFSVFDADGKEGELIYLDKEIGGLQTDEVGAGDSRQGVIAFDVKEGPVTVVVTNDYGDQASRFTVTPQ
ncbi:NINE protein [Pseudarthrobacter sp. AG30]|uniref:TM2 domain-containing protein n=1 Tax=Pseudarthrobacter sp. AG30 TaxID=2249742 RepID=UPI000D652361|nr:TM2 domain-containing protein [Pseudarthrobacter sp. AG30]RAX17394.1 NINE protein [Pseudarthrobacter sp. AG30]